MIKKISERIKKAIKFIFLEKSWKSDLVFMLLVILIIFFIKIVNPFFISVVYTNSMEHNNFFCEKYEKYNITCEDFKKFPFRNGINVGDLLFIIPTKYEDIKVGDVILYISPNKIPIVHRVVFKNGTEICLIGDNNFSPSLYECPLYNIDAIRGKVIFRIPYIGYPRVLVKRFLGL